MNPETLLPSMRGGLDPQRFNEYEQREAKNFILLESGKEEFTSKFYLAKKKSEILNNLN